MSELNASKPWYKKINVKALSNEVRRRVLDHSVEDLVSMTMTNFVAPIALTRSSSHTWVRAQQSSW